MSKHHASPSPPAKTYAARPPVGSQKLTCSRCAREYPYPKPGAPAIRCECGWRYENRDGLIAEEFRSRLGI
jgi:hypothetical protein